MINNFYKDYENRLIELKKKIKKPLSLTEKILYTHMADQRKSVPAERGNCYRDFWPDRVAMQDATAQMALLQFLLAGRDASAVPATVHCDHLIAAKDGAEADLAEARKQNREVYDFLKSVANRYGIGFWKPGSGIIHQIVLENYAVPGGLLIGTDSHTPNAGGLGMLGIGVGGADAAAVMAGLPWELKFPKVIGVHLRGELNGWTSPKDVILYLLGKLTVKGGTDCVLEYFGEGAKTISCTGKATICNMGAELGATSSIFPFDKKMADFLTVFGRGEVAANAEELISNLCADPEAQYDQLIEIDLDQLEPHINGPFSPDRAWPLSEFAQAVQECEFPPIVSAGLIGSCTNSSYEDLTKAASVLKAALDHGIKPRTDLLINPGSAQILDTLKQNGELDVFENAGVKLVANACGPCIGQWVREGAESKEPNSIVTSFNRNFARRNDGNPNTHAFVASPELVAAFSVAGSLQFNPMKDSLRTPDGNSFMLAPPSGTELPTGNFKPNLAISTADPEKSKYISIIIPENSDRIQALSPFQANPENRLESLLLLIKVKGKCTTDHISMAGPWLKYRGHLENISENLLMGAVNIFNGKQDTVKNRLTRQFSEVSATAKSYQLAGFGSVIIGDENYGEGSSREHAAMEPRFLGVRLVVAKSFARIHETNLKRQGVLALTFADKKDYDKIQEDDMFAINLKTILPGKPLVLEIFHVDGVGETIPVNHTLNKIQLKWYRAGSALNFIRSSAK
ncbi:aconitate hydratase [bacterium]|nr:aconitate hydratase [bacterium]